MKYKFEISIAEIKDLGAGPFEFKIALDSMEQHLYDTDTFEIYGEGNFALGLLLDGEVIGGFRIPMSLLHRVTSQWFPVSLPYKELYELPELVEGGRVFLSIIEISILSPVQEHREASEYSIQSTPRVYSLNESKIEDYDAKDIYSAQLSQMLEISRKEIFELKELLDENKKIIERIVDDHGKREAELISRVKTTNEANCRLETENSRLQTENMRLQVENAAMKSSRNEIETHKECLKEGEAKRKELQNFLASAHSKWQELKPNFTAVSTLEKENQGLMLSLKGLNEKLKESEKNKLEDENLTLLVSSLNSTIAQLKFEVQDVRKSNKVLLEENSHLKELIEKSRPISVKDSDRAELTEHSKNIQKTPNREEKPDSIDKALKEYMREAGIQNPFQKLGEGVYQYASKKISLSLKNGVPVIRVGGGYMFIDEFLKIYNGQAKKKPEEESGERSHSLERKLYKIPAEKYPEEIDVENYPDILNSTPSDSPVKRKNSNTIVYPTKSAILKKIPRLGNPHRELTPNSRRNRTPRQVFLP